jgi:hypothetical protein
VRHRALAIGVSLVIGSSEENINDMVTSSNEVKAPPGFGHWREFGIHGRARRLPHQSVLITLILLSMV